LQNNLKNKNGLGGGGFLFSAFADLFHDAFICSTYDAKISQRKFQLQSQ
jgi:hypothetical protein